MLAGSNSTTNPLRRLDGIAELGVRAHAVANRLGRLGPAAFVRSLDKLARDAARGVTTADGDAMLACAFWLINDGAVHVPWLLEAARSGEHAVAAAMLDDAAPHKQISRHGRLPDHGGPTRIVRHIDVWYRAPGEGPPPVPLMDTIRSLLERWGHEPSLAAVREAAANDAPTDDAPSDDTPADAAPVDDTRGTWEKYPLRPELIRHQKSRLALRADHLAVRGLLRDRLASVKDALAVATRRPITAAIMRELTSHVGWMAHPNVRAAIVENPFTPTRTALLLLPTCRARHRSIARADLHPRLHALLALL